MGTAGGSSRRTRALVGILGLTAIALAMATLIARIMAATLFSRIHLVPEIKVDLPSGHLFTLYGIPVTNTLLSCWLATIMLVALFATARWGPGPFFRAIRAAASMVLEAIFKFVVGVAGKERGPRLFPIAATIFLSIIMNAWVALLPVYGPVVARLKDGSEVPLLRGAGTDVNMTLALAIIAGVVVESSALAARRTTYLARFIRIRSLLRGHLFAGAIDLFTGVLEGITQVFRLLSFTFRLLGSMTAGEILIVIASFLTPLILPVPFYGLELFLAVVQAWIFTALTVVFACDAMSPEQAGMAGADHE